MKKTIFFSLSVLLISGCKILAYKKYAEPLSISFGSGGGFTGARNEFLLLGNGQLKAIKPFTTDTTLLTTLEKKVYKSIFNKLESKTLKNLSYDKPGNMTNFITFYNKADMIKNYQWEQGSEIPKELTELYNTLTQLTKK